MQFRYTRHQVARGSRPDAVVGTTAYLVKNVSLLRLTYQIRMLTFRAAEQGGRLVVKVPAVCRRSADLRAFVRANAGVIRVEKTPG